MHRKTPHPDQEHYWQFTGPMRADKAIHLLEGLVRGITIDHKVNGTELSSLTAWVYEHQEFEDHYPFSQVIPLLREILCDGIVGEEEIAELLWHCNEISTDNVFYSKVTSDMQRLFGVLQGIAADGRITDDEIEGLQEYLETAKHLEGHWPYTEINTLITNIYKDRFIDNDEHDQLLEMLRQFSGGNGKSIDLSAHNSLETVSDICAIDPEIIFPENSFLFTGISDRGFKRSDFLGQVEALGGKASVNVTQKLNYLVILNLPNKAWKYTTSGGKIAKVLKNRQQGIPTIIVQENDYWDAVEDASLDDKA